MAETPGQGDMLRDVEAHVQALARVMPMGSPSWAHHDLTFGQLRLLFLLRESQPVSIGQLADKLGVTDATASEFVDRVERRGLAIRAHRADDRRVVECCLSEEGVRLLAEIAGARRDGMRQVLSVLSPEELANKGILHLPGSLHEALGLMETSELLASTLGEHVFEWFIRNKRAEWAEYKSQVTQFELDRYLPLL